MCKLFDEWRNEIKDYCRQQGLNFDTAEKLSQSWNKNTVALSYRDPSKGSNGLRLSEEKLKKADKFCEGYKSFLNTAKTERSG